MIDFQVTDFQPKGFRIVVEVPYAPALFWLFSLKVALENTTCMGNWTQLVEAYSKIWDHRNRDSGINGAQQWG